jgi:hypothetical protein
MRLRLWLTLLPLCWLTALPLYGYTIYLKDGSHFQAKGPYEVQGENALIVLPNGTRTTLPLAQVDVERTRTANRDGYAGALVMETPLEPRAQAQPERPQLSEVAAERRLGERLQSRGAREPSTAQTERAVAAEAPRTAAGNVDLMRFRRVAYGDRAVSATLTQLLRARGLEEVALYEGTRPGRVFVDLTTNSEAAVFRALTATAEAMSQLAAQGLAQVQALELLMATDRRQRAGQFLITPDNAAELTSRQLDAPSFFVKYTEF